MDGQLAAPDGHFASAAGQDAALDEYKAPVDGMKASIAAGKAIPVSPGDIVPRWDLADLYPDFGDAWQADSAAFGATSEELMILSGAMPDHPDRSWTAAFLAKVIESHVLFDRLISYCSLILATDVRNVVAAGESERLKRQYNELQVPLTRYRRSLSGTRIGADSGVGSADLLEQWCSEDPFLEEHRFVLREMREQASHMMSEQEERLAARLSITGSGAWNQLQERLTATLSVSLPTPDGQQQLPLSAVRNLAQSEDAGLRKAAWEAELAAYPAVSDAAAAALNAIKGEVLLLSEDRGYASPLEETLLKSRMKRETLEALLTAMRESLPDFAAYFRKKAALLGHEGGLPFYDLFAPIGTSKSQISWTEARNLIRRQFGLFSGELSDFADRIFENRWIDAEPRDGKRGGAFCSGLHPIGQCRILSNFSGSFNDVLTLAHELGHGYHGHVLMSQSWLNADYPMPLAETASIFCEQLVRRAAMRDSTDKGARLFLLEQGLQDAAQVIVDIYSRFLFEADLFVRRGETVLNAGMLCDMMSEAQRQAYGDGLDMKAGHPYMWLNKPHYYSAGNNFYNFPYAFGLLFSIGLVTRFEREGASFSDDFRRLLFATGDHGVEEVAAMAGIDVTSPDYWRSALDQVREEIALFMEMVR